MNPLARLGAYLPMDWIHSALEIANKATLRYRRFPLELVVQFVVAMSLFRDRSMQEVLESLDLVLPDGAGNFISKSAITQNRQKLGCEPVEALFHISSKSWNDSTSKEGKWKGLSLNAMDGTTFKTPDTPLNRYTYGAQRYASGKLASYPQVRCVALMSLPNRMILNASFGNYNQNEMLYAGKLADSIPDNSLTLFDKGFFAAGILKRLVSLGENRHFLIPAKYGLKYVTLHGDDNDSIVEMSVSQQARRKNPDLPKTWKMRMIRVKEENGRFDYVLTSLLNRRKYPAKELLALYEKRWQIEIGFLDLKVRMSGKSIVLRSCSDETVRQEIWSNFIAYNLVRYEAAKVAIEYKISPRDVCFTKILHLVQDCLITNASKSSIARGALDLMARRRRQLGRNANKRCPGRKCPRTVKAKPKKYAERWVREPRGSPRSKRSA